VIEPGHPSAGWFEGRAHHLPVRVYYEDTDFTGVVYHANYLRYFERGRSEFLRLAGVSHTQLRAQDDPMAFVVARMEIDFKKPARIDDALIVRTTYERMERARLHVRQSLERDGELIATAAETIVCIGLDGRPRRPPPALTEALGAWFLQQTP
jgi:acyl-CoA thioester hydrolase